MVLTVKVTEAAEVKFGFLQANSESGKKALLHTYLSLTDIATDEVTDKNDQNPPVRMEWGGSRHAFKPVLTSHILGGAKGVLRPVIIRDRWSLAQVRLPSQTCAKSLSYKDHMPGGHIFYSRGWS